MVEVLLRTPKAPPVERRLFAPDETVCVPHLIDAEVLAALRRYVSIGQISQHRGQGAVAFFQSLRLERFPHGRLLDRVWELRHNLTAYDALYVALAEALDAPLLTADRRLAAAPGHSARIEAV